MKQLKRRVAVSMAAVIAMTSVVAFPTPKAEAAKAKVKLGSKKLTVQVGKTKTLKLKNNKKKVKWTVVSGKTKVKLKSKKKTSVKIVGKKKGTAKVQAKIGKKKYTCKVTVKAAAKKTTATKTSSQPKTTSKPKASTNPVVTQEESEILAKNIEVDGMVAVQNRGLLLRVTNNNKKTVHRVTVDYSLYKTSAAEESDRLATVTGDVYEIKAGETKYTYCPLYIAADAIIQTHRYELAFDQSREYTDMRSQVAVSWTPDKNAVDKTTHIVTVSAKNNSKSVVDSVSVLAIFYDEDGYVLDVCRGSVAGGLAAGDTQQVELFRTSVEESGAFADCASYEVWYDAWKY